MSTQTSLRDVFKGYMEDHPLFREKNTLTISFNPENIPHREKQIKQLAMILIPTLKNEKPSNIFLYGKTGSGKTIVTKNVIETLSKTAMEKKARLKIIFINCKIRKVADTEYRLIAQFISHFGHNVPYTGLPTDELYKRFFNLLDSEEQNVVIVLDEIDSLVKKIGDGVLYNLTRVNQELEKARVSMVGISNNISFLDNIDPRVKSSLSEEEIIFPPYNANELRDILTERVALAFNVGSISPNVIAKCAALAAQEHGDARRALDLLRIAGEIAERNKENKVLEKHVDFAEKKLDTDRVLEVIKTQPKQSQAVFKAVLDLHKKGEKNIQTGDVYDLYTQICGGASLTPLTQRRISDLISELDMFGIVNAKVFSKGRYGRTRKININLSKNLIERIDNFLLGESL